VRPIVAADAIDTSQPPAVSFLRHGANVVAQSLLRNPVLRGLPAPALARSLGVTTLDATSGIASVAGMADRIARRGSATLQEEPRLAISVGPYYSLDQALSRFSSHRGPIVVSPSPLWTPATGQAGHLSRMEAGDTNVETGDQTQSNVEPGSASILGGDYNVADLFGGGGGSGQPGTMASQGGADQQAPDQVQTPDQGGGGGGPAPALGGGGASVAGSTPSAGGIPGWAWLVGLGALALMAAGKKKKGRR
jgi:hypothetical protein